MIQGQASRVVARASAEGRIDGDVLRGAFGSYPTGVAVITTTMPGAPAGTAKGALAGFLALVSHEPPVVSFTLTPAAFEALVAGGDSLVVNVLGADQEELCREVAGAAAAGHDIGVLTRDVEGAGPVLDGAVLWAACTPTGHQVVGDTVLVLAAVDVVGQERSALPLLRYQRGYGAFEHGPLLLDSAESLAGLPGPSVPRIAEEVELLAEELGVECSVQVLVGDEVHIVLTSNRAPDRDVSRLGFSAPMVPPVGTLFLAWQPEAELERWLEALGPDRTTLQDDVVDKVRRVRERGWAVVVDDGRGGHLDDFVRDYSARERSPEARDAFVETIRRMLSNHEPDLRHDVLYDLIQVSAPVVDREGRVVMVLRLGSLPAQASLAEIDWWARRARQAASLISDALPTPPAEPSLVGAPTT